MKHMLNSGKGWTDGSGLPIFVQSRGQQLLVFSSTSDFDRCCHPAGLLNVNTPTSIALRCRRCGAGLGIGSSASR